MSYYKQAKTYFFDAIKLITAQTGDAELDSPNVVVTPTEPLVQKAIDLIKSKDPNFFKGVRKIIVGDEANYGHVESGPGKDPTVIHINSPRIIREMKSKMQGSPQDHVDGAIVKSIAGTIAHERGHVMDYKPESGFSGGEAAAEKAEKEMLDKLK